MYQEKILGSGIQEMLHSKAARIRAPEETGTRTPALLTDRRITVNR